MKTTTVLSVLVLCLTTWAAPATVDLNEDNIIDTHISKTIESLAKVLKAPKVFSKIRNFVTTAQEEIKSIYPELILVEDKEVKNLKEFLVKFDNLKSDLRISDQELRKLAYTIVGKSKDLKSLMTELDETPKTEYETTNYKVMFEATMTEMQNLFMRSKNILAKANEKYKSAIKTLSSIGNKIDELEESNLERLKEKIEHMDKVTKLAQNLLAEELKIILEREQDSEYQQKYLQKFRAGVDTLRTVAENFLAQPILLFGNDVVDDKDMSDSSVEDNVIDKSEVVPEIDDEVQVLQKVRRTKVEIKFKNSGIKRGIWISKPPNQVSLTDVQKYLMKTPERYEISAGTIGIFSVKTDENSYDDIHEKDLGTNLPLYDGKIVLECWLSKA